MKKFLLLVVALIIILAANVFSQLALEVVWEKPSEEITDAKFSPDGKFVYCAIGKTIKKLDVETGEFITTFDNSLGKDIYKTMSMNISDDGRYIATGNGGAVGIWDTQQNKLIKEPNVSATAATFYNNTTMLIVSNKSNDQKIILYDILTDKFLDTISYHFLMTQIQTSKDGTKFITGSVYKDLQGEGHCKVTLWDMATLKPIKDFEDEGGDFDGFTKIQISNNNRLVGMADLGYPRTAKIFDVETGNIVKQSDIGMIGYNFELLPNDYYLLYQWDENNQSVYSSNIYQYPVLFQSKINRRTSGVLISKGIINENENQIILFQGLPNFMLLYTNSITGVNTIPVNQFKIKVDKEIIIVNFDGAENMKIIDMLGNTLFNMNVTEPKISLPNIYPAGNYLCVIMSRNREYSQKFQVVR
jgi:WD40 repeat protein